jgi:hypothetical protein
MSALLPACCSSRKTERISIKFGIRVGYALLTCENSEGGFRFYLHWYGPNRNVSEAKFSSYCGQCSTAMFVCCSD